MAHLVDYEEAGSEEEKAFAALVVAERKNSKRLAWNWAEIAAQHAMNAKLAASFEAAMEAAGDGRYPNIEKMRQAFSR